MSTVSKTSEIKNTIRTAIHGKDDIIDAVICALLAGGHILLEDIPGVGKTTLVTALAKVLSLDYKRVQFTPDVLPSDLTGFNMYDKNTGNFTFHEGAVYANLFLADEINRTSPKTQSALLEVMEEGHVTVDGVTRDLPTPFFVIATQNPVETAGTFPLPEAQMDRFMMKLYMGLPGREEELSILNRYMNEEPLEKLNSVMTLEELQQAKEAANNIFVHSCVLQYMVDIIEATRSAEGVVMGVSPRGSLALLRCVKTYAYLNGREYVTPDDVKAVAIPVLAHRIVMGYGDNHGSEKLMEQILQNTNVPTEDFTK